MLACVGAICCYGIAFPYTRRHLVASGDGPFGIATGQVVLGALFLLPVVVAQAALGGGGRAAGGAPQLAPAGRRAVVLLGVAVALGRLRPARARVVAA